MLALTIGLLLLAAVLIYALGRYEDNHLDDADLDFLGKRRVGK